MHSNHQQLYIVHVQPSYIGSAPVITELVHSLPDSSFTASTYHHSTACQPSNSRELEHIGKAWCAQSNPDPSDYLQIYFPQSKQIQSITIYGRPGGDQYVTSYYLQYSVDGTNFANASNENYDIVFIGNNDSLTAAHSVLYESIIAKYVRIMPITFIGWKSLKLEIFGYEHPCQYKYGGNWLLVRHSYNSWHPATDNLKGTDVYGVYDNNPQSLNSWSIQFDNVLQSDNSTLFMFSNGDCSEWMITTNDQLPPYLY